MHEKKFVFRAAGIATGLFLLGVAFCYLLVLIICLSTTVAFANWLGFTSDLWRADSYISFVCWFMLGTGIAFELPLVLLTLVKIGILNHKKLNDFRAYWVVVGLVICGFVTPDGNPLTMLLMFLPLHVLYEVSVIIAYVWYRRDLKAAKAAEANG
jgi:sec-independent protein translocase protein TatC